MRSLKLALPRPLSAFGTPLAGDTLFGDLCWTLAMRRGEPGLTALLDGYTGGRPYAVLSDAFPSGVLPKPTLPDAVAGLGETKASERKALRRRAWLPAGGATLPLAQWLATAVDLSSGMTTVLTQNTINRLTNTTAGMHSHPARWSNLPLPSTSRWICTPCTMTHACRATICAAPCGRSRPAGLRA